ncbi:hypothetical protein MMC18_004251 [Xylographa bjoerkii]|nr:hypothetical protein [Xylographa bjoerkii]
MTKCAILGVTGSTGGEIFEYLQPKPEYHLNLYARSASKLQKLHPAASTAENVTIYTGSIDDVSLLVNCLRSVDAIYACVATNENEPECSVAQRAAHSIVSALEAIRKEEGQEAFKCPPLCFLSSLSLNPVLGRTVPTIVKKFMWVALYYVYTDLQKAEEYLATVPWVPTIRAQPGGLLQHDGPVGFVLSEDACSGCVGYPDLARAMVQMAEEDGGRKWAGKGVGIVANEDKMKKDITPLIGYISRGVLAYFLPSLWWLGRRRGYW